jgi:hypothetical protein
MRHSRLLPLIALSSLAFGQSVSGPWSTISTAHYRIHYPDREGYPAFAKEIARRIEGIHAQYLEQIGWRFEGVQDVLIGDPMQTANGSAWPFLQRPYVWLWATPPEEESVIGHHRGWEELLVVHELGHMHHLMRPQHGQSWWGKFMDSLGPIAQKSPRWVTEGYATVLEGRITGSGRPHSIQRAAVLRTWAREGHLPSYEALSGGEGFLGGSMAYLVGSAYLEWLEVQAKDPKILQTFWKQLASRRKRDFNASYKATFGFTAQEGYARFRAELAHDALREEARLQAAGLAEGQVFTKIVNGQITDLSLSPDGAKLLARVQAPKHSGLYVWDLNAPEPKAPEPSKDPEEPDDAAPRIPERKPTWTLPVLEGALARKPRWSADGRSVIFEQPLRDAEGILRLHTQSWIPGGPVREGGGPEAPKQTAIQRGESDGAWNILNAEGRPLTRTLSALWAPTQVDPKGPLFAARLTSTGVEIRRFSETPAPVAALPAPQESLRTEGTVRRREDEPTRLPAPAEPPPPHPYRTGETLKAFYTSGAHIGPWGESVELGAGFNDFLGRLNGFVIGALGDAAGPRGGAAALRWEGWRTPIQLHVYSLLERPSAQQLQAAYGLDRERRGAEAALDFPVLGPTALNVGARFLAEQEERLLPSATLHRHLLELHAEGLLRHSRGEWSYAFGLEGRSTEGRTASIHWSRERLKALAGLETPWVDLRATGEFGRMAGTASPTDRFTLGGAATSLSPASAEGFRVSEPGLPAYLAVGDHFRRLRAELDPGLGKFFVEHTALWIDPAPRPSALRVVGWELDSADYNLPLERLQGLVGRVSIRLGVYRILDGVLRHRTTASLGLSIRP